MATLEEQIQAARAAVDAQAERLRTAHYDARPAEFRKCSELSHAHTQLLLRQQNERDQADRDRDRAAYPDPVPDGPAPPSPEDVAAEARVRATFEKIRAVNPMQAAIFAEKWKI